ncbi:MAG TPA: hypothetical protein VM243_14925 [Phycisphaerae bacterium]|nr:hypothetical protein [Phycisphaerae bacterium]
MTDSGSAGSSQGGGAEAWLTGHQQRLEGQRARWQAAGTRWSWARLITFFGALLVWYPLAQWPILAAGTCLLGLILYCVAVARHKQARDERDRAERGLTIVDESLKRCGGRVTLIRSHDAPGDACDSGATLPPILQDGPTWTLTGQERDDLDLFSPPVGIFGLLNRASTAPGCHRLAGLLQTPCLSTEHILARQAAVRWLEEHPAERLRVMAAASILRDQDEWLGKLIAALRQAKPLPWPMASVLLRIWSVVTAGLTGFCLVKMGLGQAGWVYGIIALALVNGLTYWCLRRTLNHCLAPWKNTVTAARGYLHAARQGAEDLPEETVLGELRHCFANATAREALPAMCARLAWADSGGMIHAFFNVMFFYDLFVAGAILRPAVAHREALLAGLSSLADTEALTSLACFAYEQPVRCYPVPADEATITIAGGCHPLIPPERVVPNDVRLNGTTRTWVITGSNMSGKSTLLRMAGVNALLAQLGTVAVAREMTWRPVRLVSDLQVRDSLASDESYFLAEVRHLRRMLDPPEDACRILGLMDEPFRGTNSDEQVAASLAVVEHLMGTDSFFMVATHEQRITELAEKPPGANHHFREDLGASGLVFDYRLHAGPADTRNALRVLEREGYPSTLLERARNYMKDATAQRNQGSS